ncbi:hypothetical protein MAPG_08433 [Magnaporthiopsis poae ATCC 64411]|uniref:Uncharacterized protein n=1 Tax=Magnaporthiopsis poae (strain ATCC 64411 / 73-15) TaxID=644358 RepID=A0A0C4E7C2_MAGP6|nr:hypothetical protein MAPG_08433 [Magnaporthiopsis poae ATCC 64411]
MPTPKEPQLQAAHLSARAPAGKRTGVVWPAARNNLKPAGRRLKHAGRHLPAGRHSRWSAAPGRSAIRRWIEKQKKGGGSQKACEGRAIALLGYRMGDRYRILPRYELALVFREPTRLARETVTTGDRFLEIGGW